MEVGVRGAGVEVRFRTGITKEGREGYELAVTNEASTDDVVRTVELAFLARAEVLARFDQDDAKVKAR